MRVSKAAQDKSETFPSAQLTLQDTCKASYISLGDAGQPCQVHGGSEANSVFILFFNHSF